MKIVVIMNNLQRKIKALNTVDENLYFRLNESSESQENAQLFGRLIQEIHHEFGGAENCPWSPVVLKGDNPDTVKFLNLLDSTNMIQMVSGPTHRRGHTLDLIISQLNDELVSNDIYDSLCPIQTREINYRPWAPWYNDDLRAVKREKRRLERKFKKSGLTIHKNSKALPSYTSLELLVEEFNDFFINKVRNIRNELELYKENLEIIISPQSPKLPPCKFKEFQLPNESSVQQIIKSLSTKTCSLDPIPIPVHKNHLESLNPIFTDIVKTSLSEGVFPNTLKISHLSPRLKKPDLDKDLFSNFRPIANIAFLSKVLEKTVAVQTQDFLNSNNFYPSFQSAYRKFHSTETALLKVTNDILRTLDNHQDVILVMLDLSSAFDTLDHDILLARLESYFGFSDTVIKWFKSYLTGRSQSVVIGDVVST
ncbi:Hypothetical predicted protein [Paramuricea clavata]|uniref:Reverse transcriptase domain-containing protein n=1 Tax=Paramuricea clavata TaxID=317549 RepID=A0A7D9EQ98_PARCT|nr:Hypothetical predicted protein [Paramuricea clavata]